MTVLTLSEFDRQAKLLSKRYKSYPEDLAKLVASLQTNPNQGTSLGGDIYKVRMAIKSKGRGKSGGARVITYWARVQHTLVLLTTYDKSDLANLPDGKVDGLLGAAREMLAQQP